MEEQSAGEDGDDGNETDSVSDVCSPFMSSMSNNGRLGCPESLCTTHRCSSRDSSDVDAENVNSTDESEEDSEGHEGHEGHDARGDLRGKPFGNPVPYGKRLKKTRVCVRYENIWTGQRADKRPIYPVGPSDTCIVTNVPRPPDPRSYMDEPTKDGACVSKTVERGGLSVMGLTGRGTWSFANGLSAIGRSASDGVAQGTSSRGGGFHGAVECLSTCVDSTE